MRKGDELPRLVAATTQVKTRAKGSHYEVAKRLGLIGCIDGPPDLARNRRKYMRKAVRQKCRAR